MAVLLLIPHLPFVPISPLVPVSALVLITPLVLGLVTPLVLGLVTPLVPMSPFRPRPCAPLTVEAALPPSPISVW
jgi:hypothetical protein